MKKITLIVTILIIAISTLHSQELNNAYSLWGFRAPLLKSGEFIVTAGGNYSSNDYDYKYDNDPDRFNNSEYSNMNFTARGILAITDKFLINTSLYFYPKRETSNSRYGNIDYENKSTSNLQSYLYPNLTLIYKPKKNFEISGSIFSYNVEQNYETIYSNADQEPYSYNQDYRSSGGNIYVNYFGKLWNK